MMHDDMPSTDFLIHRSDTLTLRESIYRAWCGRPGVQDGTEQTEGRHFTHVAYHSDGFHALTCVIKYHPQVSECFSVVLYAPVFAHGTRDWRIVGSVPADAWVDGVELGNLFQYHPCTRTAELTQELFRQGMEYIGLPD